MAEVYLINVPDSFLEKGGDRQPLGLLYLSSWLKQHMHRTKVYDLNHQDVKELYSDLKANQPEFACLSIATPNYNRALEVVRGARENHYRGRLVAGGHHVTAMPDELMTVMNYDYILTGDGEEGLLRIVSSPPEEQLVKSRDIEPLDLIPYPDREALKMDNYNMKLLGKKAVTMISARGCTFSCAYCGSSKIHKVRKHSPKYSVGEMKMLMEKHDMEGFYIGDDIFTVDKKRVYEICDLMGKELPSKPVVRATTRVDLVDKELLKSMYEAGFDVLSFGLESGDDQILKNINKGAGTVEAEKTVKDCKEIGIKVKGFWIFGLPGETKETMQKTIDFAKKLDCEYNDIYPLVPYPSSQLWDNPKGLEILKPSDSNWEKFYQVNKNNDFELKFKHPNLTQEEILEYVAKFKTEMRGREGLTYQ